MTTPGGMHISARQMAALLRAAQALEQLDINVGRVIAHLEHKPARGDDFEQWLRRERDALQEHTIHWMVVDQLLDRYRERADYGLSLREEDDHKGDP